MSDQLRQFVLASLKVPPEPELPEGSAKSMMTFRAGRNFYRWQVLIWFLSHGIVVVALTLAYSSVWIAGARGARWFRLLYGAIGIFGLTVASVALLVTFLALRWSFELRWYILSDRSLRIRRGVWNVEELTMTFANIQEVRVNAGPIQKALGIADVEVHAAGGGAAVHHSHSHGKEAGHAAIFEGVDNASEIRDRIVERLRVYRDSGLGEHSPQQTVDGSDVTLRAARDALEAARSLRELLQP